MSNDAPSTVIPLASDTEAPLLGSASQTRSKKKLGIYYTPREPARILCSWAIRRPDDNTLEPSFGGCGFLEEARNRYEAIGSALPTQHLYGCDIDEQAFTDYLVPKLKIGRDNPRFLCRDFLETQLADFGIDSFSAVVGNPPYVSHHNMSDSLRETAGQAVRQDGFDLISTASLWAYFVLHAIPFLKEGGRMAWILPSSLLFAGYANVVREYIAQHFERVLIVQLKQRLFLSEGTEEITAVLLADNRRSQSKVRGTIHLDFADTLVELEEGIHAWEQGGGRARRMNGRVSSSFLSREAEQCMQRVIHAGQVLHLGDVADVRIGIVTGANRFFVLDESTASSRSLPKSCLQPILAKFSEAPGAALTKEDLEQARHRNRRCLLVNTDQPDLTEKGSALRNYLASLPRATRHANGTFKKRALWHRPDDGRTPDGFFPYMYQHGPRLILNEVRTTSTNTIHRVYFKPESIPDGIAESTWQKACSVSILGTFSQLSGELEGRCYGAGVLKHEPSEARRINLLIPERLDSKEVAEVFRRVDSALREGKNEYAQRMSDLFVLQSFSKVEQEEIIRTLSQELYDARFRRRRAITTQAYDANRLLSNGSSR